MEGGVLGGGVSEAGRGDGGAGAAPPPPTPTFNPSQSRRNNIRTGRNRRYKHRDQLDRVTEPLDPDGTGSRSACNVHSGHRGMRAPGPGGVPGSAMARGSGSDPEAEPVEEGRGGLLLRCGALLGLSLSGPGGNGVQGPDTGRAAAEEIRRTTGNGNVVIRHLDLASLYSVRQFAKTSWTVRTDWTSSSTTQVCDDVPKWLTEDGFETQLAVNHLGHFLLTSAAAKAEELHPQPSGRIHLDDLFFSQRTYSPLESYRQSKLANVLFSRNSPAASQVVSPPT
ncbi:hypothetical protein INR49_019694 [Caranx melampygus]|nr:hypothetical protein INR49_019694 [Caranx melampygus]